MLGGKYSYFLTLSFVLLISSCVFDNNHKAIFLRNNSTSDIIVFNYCKNCLKNKRFKESFYDSNNSVFIYGMERLNVGDSSLIWFDEALIKASKKQFSLCIIDSKVFNNRNNLTLDSLVKEKFYKYRLDFNEESFDNFISSDYNFDGVKINAIQN